MIEIHNLEELTTSTALDDGSQTKMNHFGVCPHGGRLVKKYNYSYIGIWTTKSTFGNKTDEVDPCYQLPDIQQGDKKNIVRFKETP